MYWNVYGSLGACQLVNILKYILLSRHSRGGDRRDHTETEKHCQFLYLCSRTPALQTSDLGLIKSALLGAHEGPWHSLELWEVSSGAWWCPCHAIPPGFSWAQLNQTCWSTWSSSKANRKGQTPSEAPPIWRTCLRIPSLTKPSCSAQICMCVRERQRETK